MSNCASTLSNFVSQKEVTLCTTIAPTTAASSHQSRSRSLFTITSSTRYFVAPGTTRLASRLIAINRRPSATCFRLGHMNCQNALRHVMFLSAFGNSPAAARILARGPLPERSARFFVIDGTM